MSRIKDPYHAAVLFALREAARKSRARLWKDLKRRLDKGRQGRSAVVNVGRLGKVTKEGDVVVVPGKVLGGGVIDHSLTVGAYAFSNAAMSKVKATNGQILLLDEFASKFASAKGVKLLGG